MKIQRLNLILIILLLCSLNTYAATRIFTDSDGSDSFWKTSGNWDGGTPGSTDDAQIGVTGYADDTHIPVIDSTHTGANQADANALYMGYNKPGDYQLNITGGLLEVTKGIFVNYDDVNDPNITSAINQSGGTVNVGTCLNIAKKGIGTYTISGGTINVNSSVSPSLRGAAAPNADGVLNVSGDAVLNFDKAMWIGGSGDFTINMTGGQINASHKIVVGAADTGSVNFNLHGGTVYGNYSTSSLEMRDVGNGHIDLQYDGKMVLAGDWRIRVGNYTNAGWITAYDGRGDVVITYDFEDNTTTVTGSLDYAAAYNPSPDDRGVVASTSTDLYWEPGENAQSHDVYFGTSYDGVYDANTSDSQYKGCQSPNSYDPGTLTAGTTYYWRIDENDVNSTQDGLLAWWKFNDGSGSTATDSSFNGYDATITGAAWTAGHEGNSLDFEGVDYVAVDVNLFSNIHNEISFCCWQYGDSAIQPQADCLFQGNDSSGNRVYNVHLPWSTETVIFDAGGADGYDRVSKTASASQYEGQWNHWVFTKNSATGVMNVYLNGQLWSTASSRTKPLGTPSSFYIGANYNATSSYYDGMIDDFRIYDHELSPDEVYEIYNARNKGQVFSFDVTTGTANSEYYVSPDGNDNNAGTIGSPFATITKARDTIRKCSSLPSGGVTVWLRGGKYFIDETIVFDQYDSGEPNATITYAAYQNETPIITSGVSVTGWTAVDVADEPTGLAAAASGNLYSASIPSGLDNFKMMYDGNDFLTRAIGEPFEPTVTYANADATRNVLDFPEGALSEWSNVQDVEVKIIPYYQYCMNILPLYKVDDTNNKAYTTISGTYKLGQFNSTYWDIFDGNTAWVENAPEALDTAGEWIVNTDTRTIYLWPTGGAAPSSDIVAASLTELVKVQGSEDANSPAEYINFEGITFTQADRYTWTQTQPMVQHEWEALDKDNAMLRLRWADNCLVEDCTFTTSGAGGIRLDLHAQNNRIEGNLIKDIGGTGIFLGGYGPGKIDLNKNNEILNNEIYDIGQQYWATFPIYLYQSSGNLVKNNYLHDLPHGGIGLGGHRWPFFNPHKNDSRECAAIRYDDLAQDGIEVARADDSNWTNLLPYLHARNNTIEKNEIARCAIKLGDINGMYMSGAGTGNLIARNYLREIIYKMHCAAIRTDGYMWETEIYGNIIYDKFGRGITLSDKNYCENNIIVDLDHTVYATNNWGYIHLKTGPLAGTRVKRNILYHEDNTTPHFYNYNADFIAWADQNDVDVNDNLFYCEKDPCYASDWLSTHQDNNGVDGGSIAEDPLFVAVDNGDFRLDPNSPAFSQLDCNEIDFDAIGLLIPQASRPRPDDQQASVRIDSQLAFRPGRYAASHDIYFGTNYNSVNDANTSSAEYKGNTADNDYDPGTLQSDTTYYWRVDEVNGVNTWKGDVWSFSTPIDNLIAYYKFDKGSGSIAFDSSPYGNNATITGAAWVTGQVGNALDFEGVDYVELDPDLFSLIDDEVTFCCWQYGDAAIQPQADCLFQGNDSSNNRVYNVHLPWSTGAVIWDAGGTSGYDRNQKTATSSSEYEGQWNHWAFTKNATTGVMNMYLNGQLWSGASSRTKALGDPASFHIGANYNATTGYYDGMIDDFRIYNAALDVNDINDIYMEGL